MNIELVAKNLPASDMLKSRIEQKLSKIESRLGQKLFVRVRLSDEGNEQYGCSIHFSAGREFTAATVSPTLTQAADESIAKIERMLRKTSRSPRGGAPVA